MATSGWTIMILGPLLSWVGSFTIYGFGEVIDRLTSIDEKLKEADLKEILGKDKVSGDTLQYIKECNPSAPPEAADPGSGTGTKENSRLSETANGDADWIPDEDTKFVRCPQCDMRMSLDFIKARKKCPTCGREYHDQKL